MFPIINQQQLDDVMSSRIRRERAKIHQKHAEELQPFIDNLDRMRDDLIALRDRWKEARENDS